MLNRTSLAPLPDYWTGSLFKSLATSKQLTVKGQIDPGRVVRTYVDVGCRGWRCEEGWGAVFPTNCLLSLR